MSSESENPEENPNFDDEEFLIDGMGEIEEPGEPEEIEGLTDQFVLGDEEEEDVDFVLAGAEDTPPDELPGEVPSESLGDMPDELPGEEPSEVLGDVIEQPPSGIDETLAESEDELILVDGDHGGDVASTQSWRFQS